MNLARLAEDRDLAGITPPGFYQRERIDLGWPVLILQLETRKRYRDGQQGHQIETECRRNCAVEDIARRRPQRIP
jgi:hypothetical protein